MAEKEFLAGSGNVSEGRLTPIVDDIVSETIQKLKEQMLLNTKIERLR